METKFQRSDDVPPFAAIGIFFALLIGMAYFDHRSAFTFDSIALNRVFELNMPVISVLFCSLCLNFVAFSSVMSSAIGLRKQGRRLAILTGRGNSVSKSLVTVVGTSFVALISTAILFLSFYKFELVGPLQIPTNYRIWILLFFSSQLGLTIALALSILYRLSGIKVSKFFSLETLPTFPAAKNSIVVGSTGELE